MEREKGGEGERRERVKGRERKEEDVGERAGEGERRERRTEGVGGQEEE